MFKSFNIFKKEFKNDTIEKSFNQSGGITSTVSCNTPPKIVISTDPISIVQCNSGWVFACNNKIGTYMSSVPIHLYAKVPKNKTIKGNNIQTITKRLNKLIKKSSNVSDKYDIVEITEHDCLNLIQNPYNSYTWQDFIIITSSYLNLLGNAFCLIHRENNVIVGIEPLYSEYVRLNSDSNGGIKDYTYECPSYSTSKNMTYKKEDIIHFRSPMAGNLIGGMGKAEAVIKAINLYKSFTDYELKLSNNGAVPGLILISKSTMNNKQGDFDESASRLRTQFGDLRKGSPIVLRGDVDVKQVATPPKDLNFVEGRRWMLMEICAAFGVPVDLVNPEDSNRSTSKEAMNSFLNHTILPDLSKILEQLNNVIVKEYDESLYLWYNKSEIIQEDGQAEANKIKTYIDAGVLTINEAREQLGLEPIEEDKGDLNNEDKVTS